MQIGWLLLGMSTPAVAGTTEFPGAGEFGALLFEDNWPCAGDADFNDAVVRYNVAVVNSGPQDVEVVVRFEVHALGATIHNGLGLRIPGLDVADVAYARLVTGTASSADGTPWSAPATLTLPASGDFDVLVSSDLFATCGTPDGFVNTDPQRPGASCAPMAVEITLKDGAGTVPGAAPWDVYLQRTDDPTHQIHAPQFAVPSPYFGQCDDASDGGGSYLLATPTPRLPAVLHIPQGKTTIGALPLDVWPRERARIDAAAPNILGFFAGTGGSSDWYETGTVSANLFHGGAGGVDPIPPLRPGTVPDVVHADCEAVDAASLPTWYYRLDLGGAVTPFVTRCDNDTQGGGWMLVAKRPPTGTITQVADLVDTTTNGQVLTDATWAQLRLRDEMLLLRDATPAFVFSMSQMRLSNCVPIASTLTAPVLAHDNAAGGCFSGGRDYAYIGWDATDQSSAGDCENAPRDFTIAELGGLTCGYDGATARCCYFSSAQTSMLSLYVR